MLINGMIKAVELNYETTWINAISCQSIDEFEVHKLKCSHAFKDFEYQNKLIACPATCALKKEYMVYGSDIFSEDSSICRALIYSGEYIQRNGLLYGSYSGNKNLVKEFKSSSRNKIETKYMNDK